MRIPGAMTGALVRAEWLRKEAWRFREECAPMADGAWRHTCGGAVVVGEPVEVAPGRTAHHSCRCFDEALALARRITEEDDHVCY